MIGDEIKRRTFIRLSRSTAILAVAGVGSVSQVGCGESSRSEPGIYTRPVAHIKPAPLPPLDFRELDSGDLMASLPSDVYFAFDSALLTAEARSQLLRELVPAASRFLSDGGGSILVNGHTDGVGSVAYNLQLSRERADRVAGVLSAAGVPRTRIRPRGFGEAGAVNGVRDPDARRVVVILHGESR